MLILLNGTQTSTRRSTVIDQLNHRIKNINSKFPWVATFASHPKHLPTGFSSSSLARSPWSFVQVSSYLALKLRPNGTKGSRQSSTQQVDDRHGRWYVIQWPHPNEGWLALRLASVNRTILRLFFCLHCHVSIAKREAWENRAWRSSLSRMNMLNSEWPETKWTRLMSVSYLTFEAFLVF